MPATIYKVIIPQYADWDDAITVSDATTGEALDLTGYTAKIQGRESYAATSALFEISEVVSADGYIILGTDGTVKWKLKASKTAGLTAPAEIVWDLRLVAPDGAVLRPVEGTATVSPAATR